MDEVLNEILSDITKRKLCLNEREEGTINSHDADEKSLNKEIKIHWTEGISVYQQCNFLCKDGVKCLFTQDFRFNEPRFDV